MELILKTPIEQLVPKSIDWNNKELLALVKQDLEKYKGIKYDDSSIPVAKADRAKLNGFCKVVNEMRLNIKKRYEEPYLKFKAEVDEVISSVESVSKSIDDQVKDYEKVKREEKESEIKVYLNSVIGELAEFITYDKLFSDKWLNSGTSMKAIQEEINSKLMQINSDIATIELLKSEDETSLKAYYFRTLSLAMALQENERIKAEKQRIAEAKARQAELAKAREQLPIKEEPIPQVIEQKPTLYKFAFEVEDTAERLKALSIYLKANNYNYINLTK